MAPWGFENLADDVHRRLGPGANLGAGERAMFEGRLGGDLSAVMVHRSPLAGHLARSLGASALAAGSHVLGADAALDTATSSGTALLGHELTHTLQRDTDESGEAAAQLIERALDEAPVAAAPTGAVASAAIDVEALTERVYQRFKDQLRHERDRAARVG